MIAINPPSAAILRKVPLFSGRDESLISALAAHSRRQRFPPNETLFHEGDPGYTLYIVVSGRVRVQKITPSGEVVHIAYCGPGEHFGELSLIDGKPRMADVVTAESTDLLMLDHVDFARCLEQDPRAALAIMASLADRLRQSGADRESQRRLDTVGQVAAALLELVRLQTPPAAPTSSAAQHSAAQHSAAQHSAAAPAPVGDVVLKVKQQEIADQLGVTRESVNRVLAALQATGAIQLRGRQIVVRAALRQETARRASAARKWIQQKKESLREARAGSEDTPEDHSVSSARAQTAERQRMLSEV